MLSVEEITGLMTAVRDRFPLQEGLEISLEANPETVTLEKLQVYRLLGINRLSLGAQTFHPGGLKWLGRGHGPDQIAQAFGLARRAGFTNLSLDLIYGWQDQTLKDWHRDLLQSIELQPEHLSLYSLTVEPGTGLARQVARGRFRTPSDDLSAACFTAAHNLLERHGYEHYEISNYARPGFASDHNLGYWRYREYLGLGLGASSFLKGRAAPTGGNHGLRWTQVSVMKHYLEERGAVKIDPISRATAMGEFMMVGLRLKEGVGRSDFKNEFGIDIMEPFSKVLEDLSREGLVLLKGDRIICSGQGFLFQDTVAQRFLSC